MNDIRDRELDRELLAAATARAEKAEKERDEADSTASFVLRPEVAAFAMLMEEKLLLNDHRPGWKGDDVLALLARLHEETRELIRAIGERRDHAAVHMEIGREAADVANFAMMIADVCGALAQPAAETSSHTVSAASASGAKASPYASAAETVLYLCGRCGNGCPENVPCPHCAAEPRDEGES